MGFFYELPMYYTKYRPQKFTEISKPNDAATALMNQVKKDKLAHAYLFVGPRGTGKTTIARILAKVLNCKKIDDKGDPCNKCDSCVGIKSGSYLDLIEIDAASNRGIDDIRDLRDKINLAPSAGKQKVYIIDEVHMLTTEAFNALLKTLEEPPSHATFILCTTEAHKVPETIKSRCQVFKFKRATVSQLVERLEKIAKAEKAKVSKKDLKKIAQVAMGGFRDAETILQQVIEGGLDVNSFVDVSSLQSFIDFVAALQLEDANSAIKQVNKLYEDGIDLYVWSMELLKYLRDLLFISADAHVGLVDVTDSDFASMEEQASRFDPRELVHMLEVFVSALKEIKSSFIIQLPLEIAIVKLCDTDNPGENPPVGNPNPDKPSSKTELSTKRGAKNKGLSIKEVKEGWEDVLSRVVIHNHGVKALLKSTKPVKLVKNKLILEVFYKFHKDRLETSKNRNVIELVLVEVFGEKLSIKCVLGKGKPKKLSKREAGELTDKNIKVPSSPQLKEKILDVFDGGLSF